MSEKLILEAVEYFDQGDFANARLICQRLLKLKTRPAAANHMLGNIAQREGQWNRSIEYLKKSISINANIFQFHLDLGNSYLQLQKYNDAIAAFNTALGCVDTPANAAEIAFNLGLVHYDMGNIDGALVAFEQAVEFNPQMAAAYSNIGAIYTDQMQLEKAKLIHTQAIEANPNIAEAHNNLGNVLQMLDEPEQAIVEFNTAIELQPNIGIVHRNLGIAYLQLHNYEDALPALQRFIDLDGPDPAALHYIDSILGKNPAHPPSEYVERLFDDYAYRFDQHLRDELNYRIPEKLVSLISNQLSDFVTDRKKEGALTVLDLGCGTGIVGELLSSLQTDTFKIAIDGVDLSQKMLFQAFNKNVYRHLIKGEIGEVLQSLDASERYHLILAVDVLIYVGALEPLFAALKQRSQSAEEAYFIFSTELSLEQDYQLLQSGRYAHSIDYVERLCEVEGFKVVHKTKTTLRNENDKPIDGVIFLLKL